MLSRSYNDPHLIARQSKQFRQYLELLFENGAPAGGVGKAARVRKAAG